MTFKEIWEVVEVCEFAINGLGQSEKPTKTQVRQARAEGRLTATEDHVIIVSNDPRENFTCRIK